MTVDVMKAQGHSAKLRSKRIALIVTGMRHSDAPVLTRIFQMLGCDGGSEEGQDSPIAAFNDSLLDSAGSTWADWTAFNPDWLETSRAQEFREAALDLVGSVAGKSSFFALNDFRMSALLPFWRDVLDSAGISCRFVHVLSNPFRIAERLEQKDLLPQSLGRLVWLRQNLALEAGSRGFPRYFVIDDNLADSWSHDVAAIAQRLGFAWPRLSSRISMEIDAVLAEEGRPVPYRRRISEGPLTSGWLRDAYEILSSWETNGESEDDLVRLDAISQAFDTAVPAFAALVGTSVKAAAETASREKELLNGRSRVESLEQSLVSAEEEKRGLIETVNTLNSRITQVEREHAASIERLHMAGTHEADLRQQLAGIDARGVQLAAERDLLAQTAELAEQSASGLREQLGGVQRALGSTESDLRKAEADRVSLNEAVARLESALAQTRANADGDTRALKEQVSFLESALAQKRAEADEVGGRLTEVEQALTAERNRVASQVAEIVAITKMLGETHRSRDAASAQPREDRQAGGPISNEEGVALKARLADLEAEVDTLRQDRRKVDAHLRDSVAEVASMTRLLSSRDEAYRILTDRTDWTSAVAGALITSSGKSWIARLYDLLPYAWRRRKLMDRLREQQLFDAEHYLSVNPDVAAAGIDPLRHYLTHGIREGRSRG